MEYTTLISLMEKRDEFYIDETDRVIKNLFKKWDEVFEEEEESNETFEMETLGKLFALVDAVKTKSNYVGDESMYHNLGVTLVSRNLYSLACDVIKHGIDRIPNSVDLLADYIKYAGKCNKYEECQKAYNAIKKISKARWNWRAFSFSIDYLLSLLKLYDEASHEYKSCFDELNVLAEEFVSYLPGKETAYMSKAEVHREFNRTQEEISVLEEALKNIKVAPKCSLRLADLYFEAGEYNKTLELLEQCKIAALEPQHGVRVGYLYLLSALCNIALFYSMKEAEDSNKRKKLELEIYSDAEIVNETLAGTKLQEQFQMVLDIFEHKCSILQD
ncbi:MAG: hypothetical protein IJX99_00065 [Clostridia bacterium]|nr:hypothetical protein [Clostridia bacterium]